MAVEQKIFQLSVPVTAEEKKILEGLIAERKQLWQREYDGMFSNVSALSSILREHGMEDAGQRQEFVGQYFSVIFPPDLV